MKLYNQIDNVSVKEVIYMSKNRGSIIGSTFLIGLGVCFILLRFSGLYFVASLFIGIGVGLLIDYVMNRKHPE